MTGFRYLLYLIYENLYYKMPMQKTELKEGDEVEVGLEDGKVIIKPLIAIAKIQERTEWLRGDLEDLLQDIS